MELLTNISVKVFEFSGCLTGISICLRMYYEYHPCLDRLYFTIFWYGREKKCMATLRQQSVVSCTELVVLFRCSVSVRTYVEWAVTSIIQPNIKLVLSYLASNRQIYPSINVFLWVADNIHNS